MTYPYRCSRETCKTRRSFARKIEEYIRVPRCRECGGTAWRLDTFQQNRKSCFCDGYHFPHREGSLNCKYYRGAHPERRRDAEDEYYYGRSG